MVERTRDGTTRQDVQTTAGGRTGVPVHAENGRSGERETSGVCRGGTKRDAEGQQPVLFLDWRREERNRGRQLAPQPAQAFHIGRNPRRPSTPLPRHVRSRIAALRRAAGTRFGVPGSREHLRSRRSITPRGYERGKSN